MDKRETDVRQGRMKDDKELVHDWKKKLHALEYKLNPLWNLRKQITNSSLHRLFYSDQWVWKKPSVPMAAHLPI